MQSAEQVRYRLRLAEGFLEEALQDISSQRWRSCVDHSQLAVENAAKAVLAILGPVGRTHNPAMILRQALEGGRFIEAIRGEVERIAECGESLGPEVHVQSDYGDELGGRTPWELFDEPTARQALHVAEESVSLTKEIINRGGQT